MMRVAAGRRRLNPLGLYFALASISAVGPSSMYFYLPGLPALADDLRVSQSVAQSTVTVFLIGMAAGQLLAGSLSDMYGRRRPLLAALAVFTLASVACAFAQDIYTFDALRLVQGLTGAAGVAIGRAVIRDLYAGAAAARYLSRLVLVTGLSPILAPVIGGQILHVSSWRGLFVAIAALGFAVTVASARVLPETLPPERRRPARLSEAGGSYVLLLRDRGFLGYIVAGSLNVAAVTAWVSGSSFVVEDVYKTSSGVFGLVYGAGSLMLVVGAQINAHLLKTTSPRRLLAAGSAAFTVSATALLIVVSLHVGGLVSFVVPIYLFMLSYGFITSNVIGLALNDHPHVAGAASALIGAGSFAFSAVVAPLAGVGGNGTALPMTLVIFACALAGAVALKVLVSSAPRAQIAEPVAAEAY